ncbi:MAG TPA: nucleotidyltransferase family protein [Anaerolineae bacterium]
MNKYDELREIILPVLRPYVSRVAVFGSFVRDESTPDSDIDILVELKPPGECPPLGLKWFALEEELSRILGRPVDLVGESALSPYIRPYVEREKVILYEAG